MSPVRILHTSDWHLGRSLHGFGLQQAQETAVRWIVQRAIELRVDALLVAGDVFDRAIPPIESLRLFNEALTSLAEHGIVTVATAGNHDSGDRLATYGALLRPGTHLIGSIGAVGQPVQVEPKSTGAPLMVYPLPYLEPDVARVALAESADCALERSHHAVFAAALDRISADLATRGRSHSVVMGHGFVTADATATVDTCDSERDLSVGGVQAVGAGIFAGRGFDYVALGHLHRPHTVSEQPTVRYSGSLLRYSLSESSHTKTITIVELGEPGATPTVWDEEIPQPRGMQRLRGAMDWLTGQECVAARQDFVELVVTDDVYPDRMYARLDALFPYALTKEHRPARMAHSEGVQRGDARGREPMDVLQDFYRKVTKTDPTDDEIALLRQAYETSRAH
jgi:exonuclease SbcD